MPPKAAHAQEVAIQLKILNVSISLQLSETNIEVFEKAFEELVSQHVEHIEFITKEKLKMMAVDKGWLNQPDLLDEKRKKDPKFLATIANCPAEMDSELYIKTFQMLIHDIMASKTDPKNQKHGAGGKKDTKKDAKKDGKHEEEVQEHKFLNIYDYAFIFVNMPENQDELQYFIDNQDQMPNLLLCTKQKIIKQENPDFMQTLQNTKQNMEMDLSIDLSTDFNIQKDTENSDSKQQSKFDNIQNCINFIKNFRTTQVISQFQTQENEFRNILVLENILQLNEDDNDLELVQQQAAIHHRDFMEFTKKIQEYHEFKQHVNTKKIKEETQEEENLSIYQKQIQNIQEKSFGVGLYLESLLDEVVCPTENTQILKNSSDTIEKTIEEFSSLILNDIHSNNQPSIHIHSHNDKIIQDHYNQNYHNGDPVVDRVKSLYQNYKLPGIKRHMMPDAKSTRERKSKQQIVDQLIKLDTMHYHHFRSLNLFQDMLKNFQPKRNWDLEGRVYKESLCIDGLRQCLQNAYLLDSQTLTHYDEDHDELYLIILYKNPPGRILRKQWKYSDKIMPNLQYYYKMKSIDQNAQYYDEDCLKLGNISEKIKYIYPNDLSLIYQKEQTFGEEKLYKNGILKENYNLGIAGNDNPYIWMDHVESQSKLLIENKDNVTATLTFNNGLILKFMQNGDIYQAIEKSPDVIKRNFSEVVSPYDDPQNLHNIEVSRIINKYGSIVKTMKDGKKIIYLSNGNIILKQSQLLITTNNQGKRFKKRLVSNQLEPMEPIKIQQHYDIETKSQITVRQDKTKIIKYQDGSVLIIFPDETQIYTHNQTQTICHPNHATIKIRVDMTKQRIGTIIGAGSAFASVGKDDIMGRTFDGRVVDVFYQNIQIQNYLEGAKYLEYITSYVHVFHYNDGTTAKIQSNDIVFISGQDRVQFEDSQEYFLQLFMSPNERKQGVFTGNLHKQNLQMKDSEGNEFILNSNGVLKSHIAVSFTMDDDKLESPTYSEDEYIDPINNYLPLSIGTIEPLFFIIKQDCSADQILSEKQMENYFRQRKQDKSGIRIKDGQFGVQSYEIQSKIEQKQQKFIDKEIPKVIDTITKTQLKKQTPDHQSYIYRWLRKFKRYDQEARNLISQDLQSIQNYQKQVQNQRAQNIIEQLPEKIQEQEDRIQMKIFSKTQPEIE